MTELAILGEISFNKSLYEGLNAENHKTKVIPGCCLIFWVVSWENSLALEALYRHLALAVFLFQSYHVFFSFFFLGLHLWHMEVPRLGVKLDLQLPVYTTATATQDLSSIGSLHCSSRQCRMLH